MKFISVSTLILLLIFAASGQSIDDRITQNPVVDNKTAASDLPYKPATTGSGIGAIQLEAAKVEDLAALGKVWGFLKYYHPAVARGDFNWDQELFQIMPSILAAQSPVERNAILRQWVQNLGTFQIAPYMPVSDPIKLDPDLSWIDSRTLGIMLAKQLTLVKNAQRDGQNHYVALTPNGNAGFLNEDPYSDMTFPDTGYRLLALYRYWSIIQYFYPDRHLTGEDWNAIMTEFVPRFVNATNELEYKLAAWALIGRIHDTHANIWSVDPVLTQFRGINAADPKITFVEGKAVVTGFWKRSLADVRGPKVGDVIETVNGQTVADFINDHLQYTPASNYPTQLRDISTYLLRTNEISLNVTYTRDGVTISTNLRAFPRETVIDLNQVYHQNISPFKLIAPDVGYLYPGSLQNGQTLNLIPQIAPTRALIVDLRCYPNDIVGYNLGPYLMPGPTDAVKFSNGSITSPGLFTYTDALSFGSNNGGHYAGQVVVLVNEITQSQAEFTSMIFRAAPHTTVIGSTTAGADGDVSDFYLPGGIYTYISGIGVYYPNGQETQRVGIVPDIVVQPTIEGVRAGRDEVLERALNFVNGN